MMLWVTFHQGFFVLVFSTNFGLMICKVFIYRRVFFKYTITSQYKIKIITKLINIILLLFLADGGVPSHYLEAGDSEKKEILTSNLTIFPFLTRT